jgi:molecular chaperone DnaK
MAAHNRTLGRFHLDGIPPAPRGVPQVEVTFDIDANGILNVNAKDRATGKEQQITISGSTSLAKDEIDRMVKDADAHATEDKTRREEVEARNQADGLAYQVERQLKDLGDKVPANEKARCEQLINDIRQAIKDNADVSRLKGLTSDLQQAAHSLSAAAYQQAAQHGQAAGGQAQGAAQGPASGDKGEDVIDAEFEEKK